MSTVPCSATATRSTVCYRDDPDVAKWTARFETESREIFHQRHRIIELLGIEPGMAVADIGVGTGLFVELLAAKVGTGGRVFAVDILPEFLSHIEKRVGDAGLANVRTVLCKEDSVELAPDSIDLAFACDTYHHFEFPKSTLSSIHRALRSGARLVVIDFDRVPGKSREWIIDHVRADKDVVVDEITSAGFVLIDQSPTEFLEENYILHFRKVD